MLLEDTLEVLDQTSSVEESANLYVDVRKRLAENLRPDATDRKKALISLPLATYLGSILGGQFILDRLSRSESLCDTYHVTCLTTGRDDLEAIAFLLQDASPAKLAAMKASMKRLKPRRLCVIDQEGKKFFVCIKATIHPSDLPLHTDPPSLEPFPAVMNATLHMASPPIRRRQRRTEMPVSRDRPTSLMAGPRRRKRDGGLVKSEVRCPDSRAEAELSKKRKRRGNRGLRKPRILAFNNIREAIIERDKLYSTLCGELERAEDGRKAKRTNTCWRLIENRIKRASAEASRMIMTFSELKRDLEWRVLSFEEEAWRLEDLSWNIRKQPAVATRI